MSSSDSLSNISSRSDDRSERGSVIYNGNYTVDVVHYNGLNLQKKVLFTIISLDNAFKIKVRDATDYSFNYTITIDWPTFERMKRDQLLDITFDELQPQIIDLLKQVASKHMLMRLEATDSICRLIFYEKSRIKTLIFLTVDMAPTNQRELVDEMSNSITQLKDFNNSLSTQLTVSKTQLHDTEILLKSAVTKNCQIEKQFRKDLELILQTLLTHLRRTEVNISTEITKLSRRHQKILKDVEVVKNENLARCESSARLVQSMQNLRIENERNHRTTEELRTEIENLNVAKSLSEQTCSELRHCITSKDKEMESLQKQNDELRRDIQDAAMIIAQKTKTNDEMEKDLIQANQMIVNFNNHYDQLSRESDDLKEKLNYKEKVIKEQAAQLERLTRDFEHYRNNYNGDDFKKLHHELFVARQRAEELEKQNKEAVKLNGLLTKKLSSTDVIENRNWVPPKF